MPTRFLLIAAACGLLILVAACGLEDPDFEPTTGSLTVLSQPDSALVVLDGLDSGLRTPALLTLLAAGEHEVRVARAGYTVAPASQTVTIRPGEGAEAAFTLTPVPGSLAVTSTPDGAAILIDGADSGLATPATVPDLAVGDHVVRVALAGYAADPESLVVTIATDALASAHFTLAPTAPPAAKVVLLEGFSNVCCPGCPEMNQALHEFQATAGHGPDRVLLIKYAVGYPSPTDPHYLANVADNDARAWGPDYDFSGYYADLLGSVPTLFGDGGLLGAAGDPPTVQELAPLVEALLAREPGFGISVAATVSGEAVPVTVTLAAARDVDLTGLTLNVVLVQDPVAYSEAPCPDGDELVFHWIMRDFLRSDAELSPLTVDAPRIETASLVRNPAWPADRLFVVAFVQDDLTREVLQAGSNLPTAGAAAAPPSPVPLPVPTAPSGGESS